MKVHDRIYVVPEIAHREDIQMTKEKPIDELLGNASSGVGTGGLGCDEGDDLQELRVSLPQHVEPDTCWKRTVVVSLCPTSAMRGLGIGPREPPLLASALHLEIGQETQYIHRDSSWPQRRRLLDTRNGRWFRMGKIGLLAGVRPKPHESVRKMPGQRS